MPVNKVLLEILNNHFTGVVEEMGYVIHRAAFTVFIKETWDFDAALVTPQGEIFCYPRNIGVTNMLGIHMGAAIEAAGPLEPGDVVLTNDPTSTLGMCTHLPDIMLFKPMFHDGKILCFAWCFIHSSDVGGLVPGSIAPTAFDRYQEGLCIKPTKLFRRGELNQDLLDTILNNCRIPEQNWGDMKALIAALTTAERRIGQLHARYGFETLHEGIDALLDYGEDRARAVLAAVPDGTYEFSDYVEVDYVSPFHQRVRVALTIKGSDIHLDFTGTDPQVRAAINLPSFGRTNQWIVLGIVNFLRTSDRDLPLNRGILRSVTVNVPAGSLLNPTPVAATGIRHVTGYRVSDAVLGALSQAVPDRIPAAGAGQVAIVLFSHVDSATGSYKVSVLQPMQGGCGGRPTKDGIDGVNFSAGSLRNVPTESIELEAPIFVETYMLADEVAAGRYRGGAGVVFQFRCLAPEAIVTARGMDRFKLRPYGRKGAAPGTLGSAELNPGTPKAKTLDKIDILKLQAGDVVRIVAPGGGGYDDPATRDPDAVQRDALNGFHTVMPTAEACEFMFGAERAAYEAVLTPDLQDTVARLLAGRPPSVRQYLRGIVFRAATDDPSMAALTREALEAAVLAVIEAASASRLRAPAPVA
jgi:N-methylhydantoinase B